jgi:Cys-rich protein (TIGR01571 family)
MGFRFWVALQIFALLLSHEAASASEQSCSENARPEGSCLSSGAALLQANVGKQRVTLPDGDEDAVVSAEAPLTSHHDDSVPSGHTRDFAAVVNAKLAEEAALVQAGETVSQERIDKALHARKQAEEELRDATKRTKELQKLVEEEANQLRLLQIACSSVFSIVQHIAQSIRAEFPTSMVHAFPSLNTDIGAVFGLSLISSLIWCVFVVVFASLYRSNKAFSQAVSSRPEQDFNDWTSGPLDVCADWRVCCWSCWCPGIRWADNMDMLGIVSYWVGLSVFCGLVLLTTVPGGLLLWIVASLLWMSFRQQLRMKFDMEQNTLRTFAGDCLLYCCCWPFAIAQEARHIEEASRAAHKAVRKFEAV